LGAQPMLGRTFRSDDDEHVVVLAHLCSAKTRAQQPGLTLNG